jgi:hypothetical protein
MAKRRSRFLVPVVADVDEELTKTEAEKWVRGALFAYEQGQGFRAAVEGWPLQVVEVEAVRLEGEA